jgi:hypothetical protein
MVAKNKLQVINTLLKLFLKIKCYIAEKSRAVAMETTFAFGFNQVLMAGELNILQYQFQIIYHGFIQAYF